MNAIEQMEEKYNNGHIPSCWDLLSADENVSALYPSLPNDYFKDKQDIFAPLLNPIEAVVKKYNDAHVKPYITRRNLNGNDPTAPEKNAWEIGIKIDF